MCGQFAHSLSNANEYRLVTSSGSIQSLAIQLLSANTRIISFTTSTATTTSLLLYQLAS